MVLSVVDIGKYNIRLGWFYIRSNRTTPFVVVLAKVRQKGRNAKHRRNFFRLRKYFRSFARVRLVVVRCALCVLSLQFGRVFPVQHKMGKSRTGNGKFFIFKQKYPVWIMYESRYCRMVIVRDRFLFFNLLWSKSCIVFDVTTEETDIAEMIIPCNLFDTLTTST